MENNTLVENMIIDGQKLIEEMAFNCFPISFGLGNGAVVPFGKISVKVDFHVGSEVRGLFTAGLLVRGQPASPADGDLLRIAFPGGGGNPVDGSKVCGGFARSTTSILLVPFEVDDFPDERRGLSPLSARRRG